MPKGVWTKAGLNRGLAGHVAPAPRVFGGTYERPDDPVRVLVVDGDAAAGRGCASVLQPEGYLVTACDRGEEAVALAAGGAFDIVLLADTLEHSRLALLRACLQARDTVLAIMMTGSAELPENLEALDQGAWDCLPKPVSVADLRLRVGRAADAVRLSRAAALAQSDAGRGEAPDGGLRVLGRSRAFTQVLELARRAAQTDASIFITGESGTGKELLARYIHSHSRRSGRPFVSLSCAALPEVLLEGELFGYLRGTFAGAVRDKPGLLETLHGGTLFLNEVTQLPLALQARLEGALQDGLPSHAGNGAAAAPPVDVRFLAATSLDPQRALEAGALRSDLYYLLCVVPLRLPPLRERPEDIPLLAQYFLVRYWARHRGRHEAVPHFGAAALRALQDRAWPGNVRELQNTIEHAVILLAPGAEVRADDLVAAAPANGGASAPMLLPLVPDASDPSYHTTRDRLLADFETRYLSWLLARTAGNMSRAARIAGVDRTTLYRLMEKHGLHRQTVLMDGQAQGESPLV